MARKLQIPPHQPLLAEMLVTAVKTEAMDKSEAATKSKKDGWLDLAMAMHLAAGRFASPAGIVFMPHNYLPQTGKPHG